MSQQTSLRWKDHTLDELYEQLPEEHRRRAQRLFAHLIARAARETTIKHLRRAGGGGLAAVAGGEQDRDDFADRDRRSLPLLAFDEGGSHLAVRSGSAVAVQLERQSGPALDGDGAAVPTPGPNGASR